jgi:hypothetical protein
MVAVKRLLLLFVVAVLLVIAAGYIVSGRLPGPAIEVGSPQKYVGQTSQLAFTVEVPGGQFTRVEAHIEQEGRSIPLFSLAEPGTAEVKQETADRIRVSRPVGKRAVPELKPGAARLVVTSSREVLFGLRERESVATRDLELRFDPPRASVVSMHHFVNHGGAEMVVYRVAPPDVASGVRVGEESYPGYPASGIAPGAADPSLRVAFFALLHDQDLGTPIEIVAEDEAGNRARVRFDHRVFPRSFRRSRIDVDDAFMQKVLPDILQHSPEFKTPMPEEGADLVPVFVKVNSEMRRENAARIAALAEKTSPTALWQGPFKQMSNSQVESAFADHRTYLYKGTEIDQQVHLGFDLAATSNVEIRAANKGRVLFADWLGIYGNCVILDHGMGLQSLYAHLSSFDTAVDQVVEKDQTIGRSGATGLAGGDHLHYTMLLHGRPISPVEWWDPHWIEDRVLRKLREAGATGAAATAGVAR